MLKYLLKVEKIAFRALSYSNTNRLMVGNSIQTLFFGKKLPFFQNISNFSEHCVSMILECSENEGRKSPRNYYLRNQYIIFLLH